MTILHDHTMFVMNIGKNMFISLFPTPLDHFHFYPSPGPVPDLILAVCLTQTNVLNVDFKSYFVSFLSSHFVGTQQSYDPSSAHFRAPPPPEHPSSAPG